MTEDERTELRAHWQKFGNLKSAVARLLEKRPQGVDDNDRYMMQVATAHVEAWEQVLAK